MATKLYLTRIVIELDKVGNPDYEIRLNEKLVTSSIKCELSEGKHILEIEHKNKSANDPDTAIIVKALTFNDITSNKFVWAGVYTPQYPEPWASEQDSLAQQLPSHSYLGWNGVWRLEFTAPIFTWIHKNENLGWIYD